MKTEFTPVEPYGTTVATLDRPVVGRIETDILGGYDFNAYTLPDLRDLLRANGHGNDAYTPKFTAIFDALSGRRAEHNEARAAYLDGMQLPDGVVSQKFPKETGWVFELNKQRKGEHAGVTPKHSLTDEQFEAMNLPLPPEGTRSLGILINRRPAGDSAPKQVQSAMLVAVDATGALRRYELADPDSTGYEAYKFGWHDIDRRDVGLPKVGIKVLKPNKHFMQLGPEYDHGVHGYKYSQSSEMIRPALSDAEERATNPARKGRVKRYIGSATLGLLSATSGFAANTTYVKSDVELVAGEDYRPGKLNYDQMPTLKDSKGVQGFKVALEDYRNGDVEALRQKVAASEFGHHHIEQHYFDEVEQATNNAEVLNAINHALEEYGFMVTIADTKDRQDIEPVTDRNDPAVKATAEGILDFMDTFAPVVTKKGEPKKIVISNAIHALTAEGEKIKANGLYDTYDRSGVVVRLACGGIAHDAGNDYDETRALAAAVTAHELGHVLNMHSGDIPSFDLLNPENAGYGHKTLPLKDKLRVGSETLTDYAREAGGREDVAETLEAFQAGTDLEFDVINTVTDNKEATVLASIEQKHPGFSALMLLRDLEAKSHPSVYEKVSDSAKHATRRFGVRVSELLLATALVKGALVAGREKQRRGKYTLQIME